MRIQTAQIDSASLLAFVQAASSGAFSGNWIAYLGLSGTLGGYVAYPAQNNTWVGTNTFLTPPLVPYTGGTGAALNFQAALNLITGSLVSMSGAITVGYFPLAGNVIVSGYNTFTGAVGVGAPVNLGDAVNVTYLRIVSGVLQTGINGFAPAGFVTLTGFEQILGQKSFTGSPLIPSPITGSGAANLAYVSGVSGVLSGTITALSGSMLAMSGVLAGAGGGGSPNSVTTTGNELIGGFKQFTGSPFVPSPITGSGVANLAYVSGVSGVLSGTISALSGSVASMSGALQQGIANASSTLYLISGTVTGNFQNYSFWMDPVGTGLNLIEHHVGGMGFVFTGAAFACRISGNGPVNGGILSGKLYQVDSNNTEQTLYSFTYTSGVLYSGSPGFGVYVTGRNRVGISLTNGLSGLGKFSVGLFGANFS